MADLQTMLRAFQNAKAAGDTAAASRIAKSIKQLQQQPAAPAAPAAPQQRDGAFMYGVDQAQKLAGRGIEAAGRLFDMPSVKQFGSDVVAQQEKDIKEGGYQPQYGGTLRENYEQGTFLPALGEKLLENAATGGAAIAGGAATTAAALLGAPAWLVAGGGLAVTGGTTLLGTGEAAQESIDKTGDYDPRVAAGVGLIIGLLDKFGAGKVIPTEKLAKMTAGEVIEELRDKGFGEAASAYAGRVTKAAGAEGATELAQEGASVAGAVSQGATYTPTELMDRGIDASILGGTYGGGVRAGIEAPSLSGKVSTATREAGAQRLTELGDTLNPAMVGNDPQAATELATRLNRIAEANNLNLNNVAKSSTTGAREAVDKAHIQMSEEIKQLARDLKTQLGVTDNDELSVVIDKVMAIAAQREARNKAKSTVGVEEMQAVNRLVGETQEGQRMLSLMRQMNELTTIHNEGYVGGLSKITDQLSPIPTNVGYSDRSLIETPTRVLGTLAGGYINPLIPAVQGAAVLTGRSVDALTGRRSRVAKYVRDNLNANDGIDTSGSPSVREARRREAQALKRSAQEDAERAKDIHKSIYEQNGRFSPVLPQQQILDELGLSPQRAVDLLDQISENETYRQDAQAMIKSIMEGGRIPNMSAIAGVMRTYMDNNAVERDRTPVAPQQQQAAASPAETAGYIRGIEDNRAANTALVEAVNNDPNISPLDKLALITALADLRSNLGSNPAEKAMEIAAEAEAKMQQPELADTYLMPYINRVIGQQASDMDELETNFMAVPDIGEGQAVRPVPPLQSEKVLGQFDAEGQYVAMPQGEVISGNTYDGARIYINPKGFGGMEVDATQQLEGKADDKSLGRPFRTNLYKKFNTSKNGKKTMNLWNWSERPQGHDRGENDQEFLVAFVHSPKRGDPKKHYYTLDLQLDVPTTLDKDQSNIKAGDQPFLRPSGHGVMTLGNPVAKIKTSKGKEHVIYDTIRVEPEQQPILNMSQKPVLSQPVGEQLSTDFDPNAETSMGFLPFLRVRTDKKYDHNRKILASSNPKNAEQQLKALDQLLADHPNTLASPDAFMDYLADAMGKANKDGSVPLIPYRALQMVQDPQIVIDQIGSMTQGQRELAAEGFSAADEFRAAYMQGNARADITGKLLLWGILSRGVSPYIQEAMFLDVVTDRGNKAGIGKFINDAADGNFNVNKYKKWVKSIVPKGSAGAGSTHNLNAFGETLLRKMSIKDPKTGITPMQRLHDLFASDMSGRDVRREFHKINTGVGINNKVLSFMLLVAGRNDVMVLDRIQFRNMFDDGRFDGFNIYDPTKIDKKQIAGSSIQALGDDTMGLMIYEALERDLAPTIRGAYEALGRGADFSMGRYHWESWVASSAQEVDHGTISGIINEAMGLPNPYDHINTREGRYNRFDSGAIYGYNPQTGQPYIRLPDGLGNMYEFTPEAAGNALKRISAKKVKDGIIPRDFKVSESRDGAYYERPEVNKEALRKVLIESGGQLVGTGVLEAAEGDTDGSDATLSNLQSKSVINYDTATKAGRRAPSRPVLPDETRGQFEIAQAILGSDGQLEIGKKGSPFENGIQDLRVAELLAKALDIGFQIYDTQTALYRDLHERFRTKSKTPPRGKVTAGLQLERPSGLSLIDRTTGQRFSSYIALQKPFQSKKNPQANVTLAQHIFAAFHELGHGIEGRSAAAAATDDSFESYDSYPNQGKLYPVRGTRNESMRDYMTQIAYIAEGMPELVTPTKIKYEGTQEEAQRIIADVNRLQSTGVLTFDNGVTSPIREDFESFQNIYRKVEGLIAQHEADGNPRHVEHYKKELKRLKKSEAANIKTYIQQPAERNADLIATFFVNPQMFKRDYPAAYEMVKDYLNSANSPTSDFAKFYSAPFAAVIATIMASLLLAEREEEDEKAALSMGRGALSA